MSVEKAKQQYTTTPHMLKKDMYFEVQLKFYSVDL